MRDPLLSVADVARVLNLKPSTIYSCVQRGLLPHVKLIQGKRRCVIRFVPEDIAAFIEARRRPADRTRS